MSIRNEDEQFMEQALALAIKGDGFVNPNPRVGCVIVKDGRIIGSGWHRRFGELHAERNALASCDEDPAGATAYVTLEPCCHYGKTPPCTNALIHAGIKKVVVGSGDPNPKVAGKGLQILKQAGIEVLDGVLKEKCDAVNSAFFRYITTGLPTVTMKYAMTLDGRIATRTGESKWITSQETRKFTNTQRGKYMGIMTGIGTVLQDDPSLTCRDGAGLSPVRIICDTALRTPLTAKVVTTARNNCTEGGNEQRSPGTIIATSVQDEKKINAYQKKGVEILTIPQNPEGQLDLKILMTELGKKQIDTVLLEGGSTLNWSALESGIVSRIQAYIAPKLFGGQTAPGPVGGKGILLPDDAFLLKDPVLKKIGTDILLESEVDYVHRDH